MSSLFKKNAICFIVVIFVEMEPYYYLVPIFLKFHKMTGKYIRKEMPMADSFGDITTPCKTMFVMSIYSLKCLV